MVSVDVKHHVYLLTHLHIVQELCESRGGRPGLSVLTSLLVSVDVKLYIEPCFGIGLSLSLICQLPSEDIKHHFIIIGFRAQELRERRGGRPGFPVPNSPYGFYGRKAALNLSRFGLAVWR